MVFPFSVRFNKKLKAEITSENQAQTLQFIAKYISEDKADNVTITELDVTYKGSTSIWRGSLFGSVDSGIFSFAFKNNCWCLVYQINMRKLFIGTSILSAIAEISVLINGGTWWIGIAAFSWLCGANWITNLIRHESVAFSVSAGIDELICGKTPEQEKIPGKLKSWF